MGGPRAALSKSESRVMRFGATPAPALQPAGGATVVNQTVRFKASLAAGAWGYGSAARGRYAEEGRLPLQESLGRAVRQLSDGIVADEKRRGLHRHSAIRIRVFRPARSRLSRPQLRRSRLRKRLKRMVSSSLRESCSPRRIFSICRRQTSDTAPAPFRPKLSPRWNRCGPIRSRRGRETCRGLPRSSTLCSAINHSKKR